MAQDIRELFKNTTVNEPSKLPKGHEKRFMERLATVEVEETITEETGFSFYKIAAAILVLLGLASLLYFGMQQNASIINNPVVDEQTDTKKDELRLGTISPQLKKIEEYYVANINYELSQVDIAPGGKQLFKSFMNKFTELNKEYEVLNAELNDVGPNEETINALIDNLQFRLKLLYQLKEKLNELKQTKNET